MSKDEIRKYLISDIINKVTEYIIEDTGCDITSALSILYQSPVIKWLQDPEEDLTSKSPAYIYELIKVSSHQ